MDSAKTLRLAEECFAKRNWPWVCQYCGQPLVKSGEVGSGRTVAIGKRLFSSGTASMVMVEHIVPRSRGGTDRTDNLTIACFDCNNWKTNKPLGVWLAELASFVETHREEWEMLEAIWADPCSSGSTPL